MNQVVTALHWERWKVERCRGKEKKAKRKACLPAVAARRWLNIQVNSVVQPWGVGAGRGCSQERWGLKERPAKKPPSKDKLPKSSPTAARNRYSYLHNKLIKYECWAKNITPPFISGYSKPRVG